MGEERLTLRLLPYPRSYKYTSGSSLSYEERVRVRWNLLFINKTTSKLMIIYV
jgi:hypothetical protein